MYLSVAAVCSWDSRTRSLTLFSKGGDLFLSLPSLGCEIRALPLKLSGYLALPHEFPLGHFPSSLLVLAGRPSVPLPAEENRLL